MAGTTLQAMAAPSPQMAQQSARQTAQQIDLVFPLDAREPYLDDHRPGGAPLLGTAMGIALMCRAAHDLLAPLPERGLRLGLRLEQIHVFEPLILADGSTTADAGVRVARSPGEQRASVHCVVESRPWALPATPHFDAWVSRSDAPAATARLPAALPLDAPPGVRADDVYALFFHGPAFRVVRSASLLGEGMWCEWRPGLPPLTRTGCEDGLPDPRWVELCLQTAGLLEVATTQRMLIPHRIDRIEHVDHVAPADRSRPQRLFAYARRAAAAADAAESGAIDIDLVDQDHQLLLRVSGYHTVPLPFPSDAPAIETLARLFGTSSAA